MSDVKIVKVNDDARDVKDALAREQIGDVSELHTSDKTTLVSAINEVFDNDSDDDGKIGDLSNLMTDSKSNLVGAINEVYQSADDANDAIGDLSNLTTQNKGNVVGAINEVVGSISDTNDAVTAIADRVTTAEGDIDGIESNIGDLSGLHTTNKNSIVGAINETLDSVGDIGDVNLPDLTNIQNTVDAINGVIAQTNDDLTTLTNRVQSDEGDIAQNSGDIGDLKTAVGDVEDVTDLGYNDLSDAVKQIHDYAQIVESTADNVDVRLGTNGNLSEPYADQIAHNMNNIGDMNQLTVNGRDLVDACNYLQTQIGTLSNLSTTDKTSLVNAINEVAQSGGGSGGSGGGLTVVSSYTAQANDTHSDCMTALLANADMSDSESIYIFRMYSPSDIKVLDLNFIVQRSNEGNNKSFDSIVWIDYNSSYAFKIRHDGALFSGATDLSSQVVNTLFSTTVKYAIYKLGSGGSGGSGGRTLVAQYDRTNDGDKTISAIITQITQGISDLQTADYEIDISGVGGNYAHIKVIGGCFQYVPSLQVNQYVYALNESIWDMARNCVLDLQASRAPSNQNVGITITNKTNELASAMYINSVSLYKIS